VRYQNELTQRFLVLFVAFQLSTAFYDSTDDVVELTDANFDALVTNSNDTWILQFYAEWCEFRTKVCQ
jgi:thioredoxin-like negative regulator of GroEL